MNLNHVETSQLWLHRNRVLVLAEGPRAVQHHTIVVEGGEDALIPPIVDVKLLQVFGVDVVGVDAQVTNERKVVKGQSSAQEILSITKNWTLSNIIKIATLR